MPTHGSIHTCMHICIIYTNHSPNNFVSAEQKLPGFPVDLLLVFIDSKTKILLALPSLETWYFKSYVWKRVIKTSTVEPVLSSLSICQ